MTELDTAIDHGYDDQPDVRLRKRVHSRGSAVVRLPARCTATTRWIGRFASVETCSQICGQPGCTATTTALQRVLDFTTQARAATSQMYGYDNCRSSRSTHYETAYAASFMATTTGGVADRRTTKQPMQPALWLRQDHRNRDSIFTDKSTRGNNMINAANYAATAGMRMKKAGTSPACFHCFGAIYGNPKNQKIVEATLRPHYTDPSGAQSALG